MAEEKKTEKKTEDKKKTGGLRKLAGAMKREKKPQQEKQAAFAHDPYDTLKFVLMTEKCVRQIELQNQLVFIVDRNSGKEKIRAAAQAAFNTPIGGVRTVIDTTGRKKAFIKFAKEGEAGEIAIRLGII